MVRNLKYDSMFEKMDFFSPDAVQFSEPLLISTMADSLREDIRNNIKYQVVKSNLKKINNKFGENIEHKVRMRIISYILENKIIVQNVASMQTILGMKSSRSTSTDLFDETQLQNYRSLLYI